MTVENSTAFPIEHSESLEPEILTPQQFLETLYQRTYNWVENRKDVQLLATFSGQVIEYWEDIPDTREAGLVGSSPADFELEHGFIAESERDYIGIALGKGPRSNGRDVTRLQFGAVKKEAFQRERRTTEGILLIRELPSPLSLTEWREAMDEHDLLPERSPSTVRDLAGIVIGIPSTRTGEVSLTEFGTVDVSAERDAGIYSGGEELRRWPQEQLRTAHGIERTVALFQRTIQATSWR
jgi:hypothetical protein